MDSEYVIFEVLFAEISAMLPGTANEEHLT